MDDSLAQEAISAALACNWPQAILINSQIIKKNPQNTDALNRLARAYAETGDVEKAKKATGKVLKIDPQNLIAKRCSDKWKNFKKTNGNNHAISINAFIDDTPSKTKLVNLINLGDEKIINSLNCGDIVKLTGHSHRVSVVTPDNKYIGRFPDNLATRFIQLIKLGNQFEVIIKSLPAKSVQVLVRENS